MKDTDHQHFDDHLSVEWIDHGREPVCKPNPTFPKGQDIDGRVFGAGHPSCKARLPYPAKRCGVYMVRCTRCQITVGVTTAGRPDDPRSIEINCKMAGTA